MKSDRFVCKLFNIYGLAHDDRKLDFIDEIQSAIESSKIPILLGGDFNLIRRIEENLLGMLTSC